MSVFLTLDYRASYREARRAMTSSWPEKCSPPASDAGLRIALTRLKKQGLLSNRHGIWRVTEAGKEYLEKILRRKREKQLAERAKNTIIMFDIPESLARKRYRLRAALRQMGFILIQKSVWFGPGPLSGEFVESLHDSGILRYLKFFKAKPEDVA